MKIAFVLPGFTLQPLGGYRTVYELANRLAAQQLQVSIYFVYGYSKHDNFSRRLRHYIDFLKGFAKFMISNNKISWFVFTSLVQLKIQRKLQVEDSKHTVVVATAWETLEYIEYSYQTFKQKIYYIQHDESIFRSADKDRVINTWQQSNYTKIVTSKWLQNRLNELGIHTTLIPVGINTNQYRILNPIENRDNNTVIMLYRHGEWKGTQDGIEALRLAKLKVPSMKVYLFGTEKKAHIEPWMEYHLNPSQELIVELYNKAAIFVGPSWSEGWGLPGCEAALCGCALAMTDNGGHREYAIHMETALLSEIKNPIALAENIVTLLQNNELRIKIAKQAQKHILQFDWEEAIQKFIKILK